MIFDIDKSGAVFETVHAITAGWFDVSELYWKLKDNSETESSDFWHNTDHLLRTTADQLEQSLDVFVLNWRNLCIEKEVTLMGYHCARNHQQAFRDKGIIPLTTNVISNFFSEIELAFPSFKLSTIHKKALTEIIISNDTWKHRVGRNCGPHFFLSYKSAQNPENDFHKKGFEIWWLFVDILLKYCRDNKMLFPCSDRWKCREIIANGFTPLIIHCSIPFSSLPKYDFYISCMLLSYFLFIDPDDDLCNFFDGWSIDLEGNTLDPKNILTIEEINQEGKSIL